MPHIRAIYRYPIKGLSPEPLRRVALTPGETIPGDRLYAIENGPSGFDPQTQPYLAKQHFLMLMKNERLARLHTSFDHQTHTLTILFPSPCKGEDGAPTGPARSGRPDGAPGGGPGTERLTAPSPQPSPRRGEGVRTTSPHPYPSPQGGGEKPQGGDETIRADLRTAPGRAAVEAFFAQFCANELRGPPRILHAQGHSFSDVARKVVSIINLASVAAVETMLGAAVDPLRFRGNLYVDGLSAGSELDLVGQEFTVNPPPHAREADHAQHGGAGQSSSPSQPPQPDAGQAERPPQPPPPERGRAGVGVSAAVSASDLATVPTTPATVRLKIIKRIVRCAATNVDPSTGARDLNIPQALLRTLGHADCGVYAEVVEGGEIAVGDEIVMS